VERSSSAGADSRPSGRTHCRSTRSSLGEEALRALFGFVIEGYPNPDDVDADAVHMYTFRVADSTGVTQAEREVAYAQALAAMGPSRIFRMGADGHMREVGSATSG
jgi:hypothetical protein